MQFTNGSKLMSFWAGNPFSPHLFWSPHPYKRDNQRSRIGLPPYEITLALPLGKLPNTLYP